MKHHFASTKKNVIACTSNPDDIKDMFTKLLRDKEKIKEANHQDCFEEVDIQNSNKKGTILVNSPSGTILSKSIDTSNVIKDVKQMFELFCSKRNWRG